MKFHSLNLLKKISFLHFFVILTITKIFIVFLLGFHYEQDTPRYLLNIRHLYNPPLYSIVLRIITTIYANLYFTILSQTIIFSFVITYFSYKNNQNQMIWALFWAIEPFSAFYCSNLMSEWLFIALLYVCYSEFKNYQHNSNFKNFSILISCAFLLYMTRYIGITFFLFFILHEVSFLFNEKRILKLNTILTAIILFFLLSLPIRIVNYFTFNTWAINAYDGLNLWNSFSVLYPNSQIYKKPQTDFEQFLTNYPDTIFSTHHALMTNHMWMDSLPALTYAHKNNLSPVELNSIVTQTAIKLINCSSILDYFQLFVIPNFLKPFYLKKENIGINGTYIYIEKFFGKHKIPDFQYHYEFIILLLIIIITNFLFQPTHFLNGYLIFYWLFIGFTSAIFMRYLYAIIPLALYSSLEIVVNKKQY